MTTTEVPQETSTSYPMTRECPYRPAAELGRLQAEEPITRARIWDGSTPWLLTRYADVRSVLADPRFSSDPYRDGYPTVAASRKMRQDRQRPSFIFMDDPDHARLRKMLIGEFTVRRIETLRPLIEQTVIELLDAMEAGPRETGSRLAGTSMSTDLVQAFALPLPSLVICHLLGVPYSDHAFFQEQSHALLDLTSGEDTVFGALDALQGYLDDLAETRRRNPADDLISRLGARVDAGELEPSEVSAMAFLLLVAGHETTANMIGLGTLTLLHHPDQAALVRDGDTATVRSAVEELLRVLTVTHLGRRRVALTDVEVDGTLIRAGEGVILAAEAANRDPEKYSDPDDLDVTRGTNQHVAFGFGIHQCLGQPLARIELQIAYPALLRRFPDLRVTVPDSEIRFRDQMAVYGVHELPVAF
ncbi:cytochrome P450 [Pseudonocardia sp. KRD291]|uniref:cytochrome P450 n=1 Tax=Pseudonocardia sp. KRD291 TaxID=2792007 RepID=UPI001C4A4E5F|nr:cytochrome P450 [Pseudonocardia sp. KRD291]MBW0101988.1 cytochrome P450 [Pseudonocardia sp. KRD291]